MTDFEFNNFFSIDTFEYKQIFINSKDIWEVLYSLKEFILSQRLNTINSFIPSSCTLINKNQIYIDENCEIEPNTYIKGPVIIEKGAQIRHGAYIRGNTIIGKNAIVGHTTEVKNSIFLNDSKAAHFAYVGDSILGNNVNLGAGVKCANYRLDRDKIYFRKDGNKINTGLSKLGAIIGDNTQIGCNSVLNPATFIQRNVIIYSCLNVGGYIKENSIVKPPFSYIIKEKVNKKNYAASQK